MSSARMQLQLELIVALSCSLMQAIVVRILCISSSLISCPVLALLLYCTNWPGLQRVRAPAGPSGSHDAVPNQDTRHPTSIRALVCLGQAYRISAFSQSGCHLTLSPGTRPMALVNISSPCYGLAGRRKQGSFQPFPPTRLRASLLSMWRFMANAAGR